jgi:hypothetical protein
MLHRQAKVLNNIFKLQNPVEQEMHKLAHYSWESHPLSTTSLTISATFWGSSLEKFKFVSAFLCSDEILNTWQCY